MELGVSVNAAEQWETKTDNLKEWNPALDESKILKKLDPNTDIITYSFKPLAGGLISPREFTVYCRKESLPNHSRLLTAVGAHRGTTEKAKGVVKGWTGPSGFILENIDANRCRMTWIINSDSRLPKSLPKPIADNAFIKLLVTMLRNLRDRSLALGKK